MAVEVKVMDMAQFAEILKSDQRNVSIIQYGCKQNITFFYPEAVSDLSSA
jgi:hypothetical protein